jgi:hypothetical protein
MGINGQAALMAGTNGQAAKPAGLEPLLKLAEAAKFMATSERALWAMTSPRGPLKCVRLGRSVRYDLRDLRSFIDSKRG